MMGNSIFYGSSTTHCDTNGLPFWFQKPPKEEILIFLQKYMLLIPSKLFSDKYEYFGLFDVDLGGYQLANLVIDLETELHLRRKVKLFKLIVQED